MTWQSEQIGVGVSRCPKDTDVYPTERYRPPSYEELCRWLGVDPVSRFGTFSNARA